MDRKKIIIAARRFGKPSLEFYETVRIALKERTDLTDEEKQKLFHEIMNKYKDALEDK